jgi:hypothetical protein
MIFFEKGREYAPSRKKSYPQSAKPRIQRQDAIAAIRSEKMASELTSQYEMHPTMLNT